MSKNYHFKRECNESHSLLKKKIQFIKSVLNHGFRDFITAH